MTARRPLRLLLSAALAPLACWACGTAAPTPEPPPPPPGELSSGPWTQAFLSPSNLIADEIVIEGPPALRNHFGARQDPLRAVYSATTTPKGFLQEMVARQDAGFVELHATLDKWELVALRRITWLERPASAPVVIRASGGAVFQAVGESQSLRGELLEFRGDVPR